MKFSIIAIVLKNRQRILSKFYVKPITISLAPYYGGGRARLFSLPPLLSHVGMWTINNNNIYENLVNNPLILGSLFVILNCILLIILSLNIKNNVIIIEDYFFKHNKGLFKKLFLSN